MIFRTQSEPTVTFYKNEQFKNQFGNDNEWVNEKEELDIEEECRIDIPSWQSRYNYECEVLDSIIDTNSYNKIIELGSGPGELGQKIIKSKPTLDYTFIDQPGAKQIFDSRNYKGKFLVKDLMNEFNTSDLDTDYEFLITNLYEKVGELKRRIEVLENERKG